MIPELNSCIPKFILSISHSELSIDLLKRETQITDEWLDQRLEEADLPEVAACFDNTEDYVEKLGLTPGQQTDVMRTQTLLNSTQVGMKVALKYWRNRNPVEATFRALLLILLSLLKGDVAVRVCKYLSDKCELMVSLMEFSAIVNVQCQSFLDLRAIWALFRSTCPSWL